MLSPAGLSVLPWLCCCLVVGDAGLSPSDPRGEEQKPRLGLSQSCFMSLPHLKITVWLQCVSGR